jgi:predicted SprT family Zn-dependent metalloprotease
MKEFDLLVRILRKEFKDFKFRVRRLKLAAGAYGTCEKKGDVFFISIHKDLNEDLAIHILVHELAHMLVWDEPGDIHNEKWGKAYSRVYRIFVNKYVQGT